MEDDLNGIEGNIRACIISNKRPMSVRNLSRDYETYTGHQIPYRQHKFSSLEAFLKSFKSLRVCGSGDMMMVEAASSEASSHIAALISKQKSSARKVPPRSYPQGGRGRGRGNYYSSRPALRETNTRRDYSGWNQSNRDNSDRQSSWDYCTKGSTAKENVAERDSRPDASGDHSSWDNNRSEPKRYSPNLQVKHDYAHTKPSPLTIKVEDDKRKVFRGTSRPTEVPPRFRKVKEQTAYIPQASSVTSGSQMVPEIQVLGSSYAKDLVTYLQIDNTFSSEIKVPKFFNISTTKIKDVENAILREKLHLDPKIPLLIMLGENDVLMTKEKIKEIGKSYVSLVVLINELYKGMQLILAYLPICICSYKNQSDLERIKSFNEFVSIGLKNYSKETCVLNTHKVLDKFEYFNCENPKFNSLFHRHMNETGYSTLVRFLISQLHSHFSSVQMVPEIQVLGSSYAKDLVTYLHTDNAFSSEIKVSRFLNVSTTKIKDIENVILREDLRFDPKIPLLIMLGENDVLMTSDKIKEIRKSYISLVVLLNELYTGMQLILAYLPICICSYMNQNDLERIESFNDFLSSGLKNYSKDTCVLNTHSVLDKVEYFNCENPEFNPLFHRHMNEKGYSTLVRFLISELQSHLSSVQGFETDFILDSAASTSASIISPLGPSQLIAAGRAKQEEEKAKWKQQSYGTPSDFLWQSSSQRTNNLTADFARLSHQDSFNGADAVTLQNHQASFIGQQIAEDPSVLPLPEAEVPLPADPTSLNYIDVLHRHCKSHGWPDPTYKVVPHKCPDTRKIVYFASVTVNGEGANAFKISTIPFEHVDVTVVTEYAAQKALERILEEESKVKGDKKISSDKNIICKRISEIVAGATTGLFAKSVEDEYDRRYNELLPHDWQETVKKWPTIDVEETVNSTIIVPRVPSPEVNQINFDPTCAPPLMPIENLGNHEGYEDVYVTHATSVSSVWFRVIGKDYSEKYDELLDQMGQYYDMTGAQELAITLEVGQYYAAYKCQTWFRVCVLEVDEANKTVTAWLIDLGDNDIFEFGSLYRLAPQFCELPQQAVQCILEGLESFGTDKIACEVVMNSELLIDKTLIAKIVDKDSEFLKVILYDTSGDDDIVVNEEIKREIIEKTEPELPAEGCVAEVVIGDISRKGEVYIMFPGPSLDRIAELIESLGTDKINKHKLNGFKHIMENKLYLARYTEDDMWYRAVVTGPHSVQLNKIPVRFVDYGNTESVEISNMADLESLSPFLYKVPYQSKQVALHNIPCESLTNSEIAKLHSLLLDEDKSVLIKTISRKADPPIVEIFTKEADTSGPVSVCFTIELDRKNKNSPSLTANANIFDNIQDEFDLASPDFILDKNSYEIVLIPLAAHPGNFIFQPYKYQLDLKKLKGKMCAYYEAGSLPELSINRIVKNKLFAAQYEADGMWYRVVVTDSPMGSKVAVRLCDFGDCSCVNISSLRELAPEFHKYPFMAVKGKLAGVKPLHKDWSVEDCIRFQDLVVTKLVAGQVEHIETNQNTMDMVVTLTLIDTTSAVDVNIADILVNEQRAVKET